jgi:prefoldin subunit 5
MNSDKSDARYTFEFVFNVLRQHENDLDRLISELELIVNKIEILTNNIQKIADDFSKIQKKSEH